MKQLMWVVIGFLMFFSINSMAQDARLQVIHNSADPAAGIVDIYLNGNLALDNFAFRQATPFINVPSNVFINIGVAPANSSGVQDTIKNFVVKFDPAKTYVAIANGVLNPSNFSANPDGRNIFFTIFSRDNIRESGKYSFMVEFVVFHGATDTPGIDVLLASSDLNQSIDFLAENEMLSESTTQGNSESFYWNRRLVNNLYYGEFSSYRRLRPRTYLLEITPAFNNSTVVATFQADLSGLGGGAAVVFASGFLNPAANQNGAAFGLFAALPNGVVVEFPLVPPTARLQVIHNAADPAAALVDIYVNGALALDNFAFRSATPFIDVPAGVVVNIGVAPGSSSSAADTLKNFEVMFLAGGTYVAIANGVLDPSQFAPNPDGRSIGFTIFAKDNARESSLNPEKVDLMVVHGSTDAPTVNIFGLGLVLRGVSYGDLSNYLSLNPTRNWVIISTPFPNFSIVAVYRADLRGLAGQAAVVFASGFLNPANNQNGEPFGLFVALPNGVVVELPAVFGSEANQAIAEVGHPDLDVIAGIEGFTTITSYDLSQNYPNPFNPTTRISFSLPSREFVSLKVFDITGREVAVLVNDVKESGAYTIDFNAGNLPTGIYFYRIDAGSFSQIRKMMLVK